MKKKIVNSIFIFLTLLILFLSFYPEPKDKRDIIKHAKGPVKII